MTAHVAITYLESNSVPAQIAVQAVPIGGIVPPIHPPQLLNPGQSVEFDIDAGWELVIAANDIKPRVSVAPSKPVMTSLPGLRTQVLTQPATPAPVAKPLYTTGTPPFPTVTPAQQTDWTQPTVTGTASQR